MHPTFNDLPLATRKKVIAALSPLLADSLDLYSQVKQAHWNVRGISFIAVHELFDKTADVASEAADDIAERMLQLGGEALGTVRVAAKTSRLKEYPLARADVAKHCEAVAKAISGFTALLRKAMDAVDDAGDAVTADMLTEITALLDKQLWFVEAHLNKE